MNTTYLGPEELADRYGVPLQTVYQWNYHGTGPRYRKFGKHVRYRSDDVERWEDEKLARRGAA